MGYLALLIHTVTITNPGTESGTDRYGNPLFTEVSATEPARVEILRALVTGEELTDPVSRDTRETRFRIHLTKDTIATGLSVITWEGRTLKAHGEPRHLDDRRGAHHVELTALEHLG